MFLLYLALYSLYFVVFCYSEKRNRQVFAFMISHCSVFRWLVSLKPRWMCVVFWADHLTDVFITLFMWHFLAFSFKQSNVYYFLFLCVCYCNLQSGLFMWLIVTVQHDHGALCYVISISNIKIYYWEKDWWVGRFYAQKFIVLFATKPFYNITFL